MTDLSRILTNGGALTRRRTFFASSALANTAKLASTVASVQTVPSGSHSGETWPTSRAFFASALFAWGNSSLMGTANVAGATLPSFHAGNDTMTLALLLPAFAGTRTGP